MTRINEEPLQNVFQKCAKCSVMISSFGSEEEISIGDARRFCMRCKKKESGIYKFDAIYTAISSKNTQNKRKKETYSKRYGKAVENLRKEEKSIRKIAEILGISTRSVQNILKKI